MADNDKKRYYWLKLKKDFFQSHKLKVLKALPNGRLYTLIYLELLAESTSHDGRLRFSDMLPYDVNTLSAVIDEDRDNVEKAIEVLSNLELLEILSDKTIYMLDIQTMIGSETGVAERVREYRKRQEQAMLLQCNTDVTEEKLKSNLEYREKSKEYRYIEEDIHIEKISTLEAYMERIHERNIEAGLYNNADAFNITSLFKKAYELTGNLPNLSKLEELTLKVADGNLYNQQGYIYECFKNEVYA